MEASEQLEVLRTSSNFAALSRYTKAFDLFKVMGVSSKELVHSNILAALMNEHEAHGLGAWFRDAFVASLSQMPCMGHPLSLQVLEGTKGAKAKIARELAHIDVLLDFPTLRLVIAIENKIWAADQHNQVARYQKALCELYPNYESRALVYLTPTGRESPTLDSSSSVPVYYQSYGELAALLRQSPSSIPAAAHFIDQFITHVEKTMSGNSELNHLCWEVFQQNEDAYAHLVKHYEYCKARKMTELFRCLQERLVSDGLFVECASEMETRFSAKSDKQQYDLDVRLRSWPDGVWVKIYKHTWFGVFPFFSGRDCQVLTHRLPSFTQPAHAVPDWADLYFASTRYVVKEDRCVLDQGDKATESHLDEVLTRVHDCIVEISRALETTN
ncbi:PD-(D/E)XK nuclease family protein [Pseudomonas svalbardensis]|uniref:PDDEXK-like family protein n=1 Tax=Pseudomonas svalbardensis TaxID=3042029 RepID=UPI0024B37C03|nr:PD-(D/E)XK nuclease family protein [Pseudomonas sp. PMCC200367]